MKFVLFVMSCCFISLMVFDRALSQDCPQVCTLLLAPVCGRDAIVNEERVFSNECVLKATNCMENKSFVKVRNGLC